MTPVRVGLEVSTPQLPSSTRIGRFVIMRKLGEGGMGIVYAAYDEELDRKIAIKLVRASSDDSRARAQTLGEAKAMARLSHPHVVQVYEVGEFNGQVFLAMEYVRGETLRAWLRARPRPWREVVALFRQCGAGLVAAHEADIVHRDFKPDNVLVAEDGRARVLDFGLARAHAPLPDDGAPLTATRTGRIMGTPAYMSPEQHRGAATDARTDQFSFCVALWEALYRQRPFTGVKLDELRVSTSLGVIVEPPRDNPTPTWLRRVLERGLAADPDARWPSMAALLEQLGRDPGRARLRLALGLALVGLLVALGLLARRPASELLAPCEGGRERLAEVWSDARAGDVERALAATEVPYAQDTFRGVARLLGEYIDAWVDTYKEACVAHHRGEQSGTLLDRRMSCLERRRTELAALVDVLADATPGVVENAVRGAGALPPITRCSDREALLAELAPPADPEVAAQVDEVRALLAKISANTGTGRHDQSRALARDAVARAEALGYRPLTAEALVSLGRLQEQAGELAEAETSLQRAYWAAEASHHETTKAEAAALIVTVVGVRLARPGDVNVWRELALAILERVGQGREVQGTVLSSLGALARHQGDLARALDYYKRALELYLALRGPEHPTVALARNNVAAVLAVTGERSEALAQFEAALASLEASFGPRHPLVGYVLINIGMIQYVLGDLDRAAAFQERALTLYDELGPDHPNVAAASNNLATVHLARRDYDLARDHLDVALAIRERHLDLDHPDLAPTLINTGMVALEEGSLDDAERYFLAAASILERHFGPDTPALFYSLTGRGRLELARGRPYAATLLLEEALTKTRLAADDRELALCQFALAQALVELHGVDAQALELAGRARAAYDVDDVHLAARRDEIAAWMRSVAPGGS